MYGPLAATEEDLSNTECLDSDGSLESEARVDLTRIVQEEDTSSLATSDREITINFFGCCPTALRVANPSPRPPCTVFIECKEDGPARIPPLASTQFATRGTATSSGY